jgi:hypothetical protein
MADPAVTQAFLQSEIEALELFGVVVVGPAGSPLAAVEVTRREDGVLEVRIPGRPPVVPGLSPEIQNKLRERGFVSQEASDHTKPWVQEAADAAAAMADVWHVLTRIYDAKPEVSLDVAHGSHKAEHEARQKLAEIRERLEPPLQEMVGERLTQDTDGDYVFPVNDVHVTVAPRVLPGGRVVVRVFAIANMGVNVTPELGLFLARLNFSLMFGRFALDAEHRSIWFDETLLGDQLDDELLRFTVGVVATTADEWDDRLKEMFGGATYQEILTSENRAVEEPPSTKPGEGGYI